MENKKLTQEELQQISSLKEEFNNLINAAGVIEFQLLELELEKENIKQQLINSKNKEVEIMNSLVEKYGNGSVSLETGEFITL
jgi:hypothetical protein